MEKAEDKKFDVGTVIPQNKKGQFDRKESDFRDNVSAEEGAKFPVESGRYHLYINLACPWANACLITLYLNGLDKVVSVSTTAPEWGVVNQETGRTSWVFDKA